MYVQLDTRTDKVILRLSGKFDFEARRDVTAAFEKALAKPTPVQIVINFYEASYIDSSALGQLLVLQEKAANAGRKLLLSGARGMVDQVLKIANFEKRFQFIEHAPGFVRESKEIEKPTSAA
jgi:anti-anti-sigma factor